MAGKGDSDAMGGVNSGLGVGTGTWRVTGQEGLEGRHGELLGIEDDVSKGGAEEPTSLGDLQREAARALFTGARGGHAGRGTRLQSNIGSMQDLFGLRDRIRGRGAASRTGRRHGNRRTVDETNTPAPPPPPQGLPSERGTLGAGPSPLWYPPSSLTSSDSSASFIQRDSYDSLNPVTPVPYTSLLYRVDYRYDADRDGVDETVSTYMRIYVPTQIDLMVPTGETAYGVVLLVDGGGVDGVGERPRIDKQFSLADGLAAGASSTGERDGPPMVVITFTLPGRYSRDSNGQVVYAADGDSFFVANWTPATKDPVIDIGTGDDLCGSMTMAAMDAVVAVAMALLNDFDSHLGFTCDRRLMVSSSSNGLSAACKWIASTSWDVHALVDWEGPPNSLAQSLAAYAYTPIDWNSVHWDSSWDVRPGVYDPQHPPEKEYFGLDALTFDCWQAWFDARYKGGAAYSFFFRPPLDVLPHFFSAPGMAPDLGMTHASEIVVDEYLTYAVDCGMNQNWYDVNVYNGNALSFELMFFWLLRSAEVFLPRLAESRCAYVRIQYFEDHAQPPWWFNRHANIALNAAWDSGANPHVYYADTTYSIGTQPPTQLTGALQENIDPASFDPLDRAYWPEWPSYSGPSAIHQLDLLRWAYETTFLWAAGTVPVSPREPYSDDLFGVPRATGGSTTART